MKHVTPLEIKNNYKKGKLEKAKYIDLMYDAHARLFDYARLIRGTDISKIEITDKEITATTKNPEMKFICNEFDKRIAPYEIINFDDYEKEYSDFILKLLKDGDTVFDIGANAGYYSIFLGKKFKKAKIYAFEPVPETFLMLKKNIRLNGLNNIKAFNFGFGNEEKTAPFYFYKEGSGNASARKLNREEKNIVINCRIKRMDDFIEREKIKIDLIKCDVEGAELNVFKGGERTLKRFRPVIMVEMLRKWSKAFGYHPNDTINFLKNLGYSCFTVSGKKLKKFNIMDEQTLETNFVFLPEKKHYEIN